jgi:putative FmdB family regulatory protein
MPLYEYLCEACDNRFEVIHHKFSDPPVDVCKVCGRGPVQRMQSSPAIQFKGSGWYVTDYAKKAASDSTAATPSDAKSTDDAKGGATEKKGGATEKTTSETASKSDSASSPAPAPAASPKK